jgi:hypothetical protein
MEQEGRNNEEERNTRNGTFTLFNLHTTLRWLRQELLGRRGNEVCVGGSFDMQAGRYSWAVPHDVIYCTRWIMMLRQFTLLCAPNDAVPSRPPCRLVQTCKTGTRFKMPTEISRCLWQNGGIVSYNTIKTPPSKSLHVYCSWLFSPLIRH